MKGFTLWLVMITCTIKSLNCLFFHEPSASVIEGKNKLIGYSFGYQKQQKKLVSGDPSGVIGNVEYCPVSTSLDEKRNLKFEKCESINEINSTFSKHLSNGRRASDDYKYMFGATIAILNDSFVTCAPMWSGEYDFYGTRKFFVWGACFDVRRQTVTPLTGLYGHPRKSFNTEGSFGWRTLVDEINNILLISKPASPSLHGDIAYVNIKKDGLGPIKSLVLDDDEMKDARKTAYQNMLRNSRNLGSGLTSGQFWHMDDIVYAVSFTDSNLDGGVIFLRYKKGKLSIIMKNRKPFQLNYDDMGVSPKNIMFGAALCAATLYGNSYTDLVVGAPAQHGTSASDPEFGAIHIYKGSFKMEDFIIRKLTLISVNEESRFGSSVVANDLDGDGLQELFVSAPYQNEGVVYVLSGYEIREISKQIDENGSTDTVDVSDLKYTQIIKREGYKRLGFSIGVMSDMDSNGCDEIAIGAPASNKIMILRCIPAVTINVTTELDGPKIVPESENEFKIKTCINLEYKSNMDNIAAHVSLKNTISGTRVNITCRPKLIDIDISSKENTYCHIVNVYIVGFEPGLYTFTSEAKLITAGLENTDFNPSWVNVTPYSIMKKTQLIERGCSGEECIYHFKMNFLWSGGEIKKGYKYDVNSMKYETLTLHITNEGRIAFTACALVNVVGAPVDQLYCSHGSDGYLCRLPEGFRKNTSYDILIKLETSRLTNEFTGLNVTVNLYEECDEKNSPIKEQFYVEYDFTMDRIEVQGVSETRSITEKAIKTSSGTIDVTHTYRISNKGTVSWKDVVMDISVQESNFIKELLVTSENQCKIINQTTSCSLDLIPSSTLKIVVTIVVWKNQIEKLLLVKKLAITSNISLKLLPTTVIKTTSVTSVPVYEKDTTIGQNKSVIIIIAILVAAILFAIVIYILYRVGFFRRKQKEELQAEIKRRSVKRPNTTSQVEDSLLEINDDEIYDDQDTLLRDKGQPSSSKQPSRISTSKNVVETENAVTAEEKTKSIVSEENKS